MNLKDKLLRVELNADELVISIGKDTLLIALELGRSFGLGDITVTDKELFLKEFVSELKSEREDGSTLLHEAFDQAVTNAIENGAEGVNYDED